MGHFTAKEFRTWNATVLTSTPAGERGAVAHRPAAHARDRSAASAASRNYSAHTPTVTRKSYIDPRLITRYETDGHAAHGPRAAKHALPVPPEAELAVARL